MSVLNDLMKLRNRRADLANFPDSPSPEEEVIEVLDDGGRPVMLMPRSEVIRQNLRYKVVLVIFRNPAGKIYIQKISKHKKLYPGLWNCSAAGFVRAGESVEEAALRELEEEIGISGVPLKLIAGRPASEETARAELYLFMSEISNIIPTPNPEEVADGMFISYAELNSLIDIFPDAITPALNWAFERISN